MEKLQIAVNVGLIITAAAAVITLVLNIFKDLRLQRPKAIRRRHEYENDFCDGIYNYGSGVLTIVAISYLYKGKEENSDSLVELYCRELGAKCKNLEWSTFADEQDLIDRRIMPGKFVDLVAIDPLEPKNVAITTDDLVDIRENIQIRITYKNIFGKEFSDTI